MLRNEFAGSSNKLASSITKIPSKSPIPRQLLISKPVKGRFVTPLVFQESYGAVATRLPVYRFLP